eukprot:TRINITY_DN15767_c0_g1_i1.p1 TRINITY_DN15767_c0_g1~~TRINITY_DN15767_c0_g1_i1.p1  ORF type:complete len:668 (+),score=125.90 TRINITY_DN15767_c0_g1_i1:103-2106(+)
MDIVLFLYFLVALFGLWLLLFPFNPENKETESRRDREFPGQVSRTYKPPTVDVSSPPVEVPVLIVGAGPVGLTASLLLAKHKIKSLIVERRDGLHQFPQAHQLNIRSCEILLSAAGVPKNELYKAATKEEDIRFVAYRKTVTDPENFALYDHRSRILQVEKAEHSWAKYLNITQNSTERVLFDQVKQNSNFIETRFFHEWQGIDLDDPKSVTCFVCDRDKQKVYRVKSKYVLDCSGAGSRVRDSQGVSMVGELRGRAHFLNICVKVDLSESLNCPTLMSWLLHPGHPGTWIHHDVKSLSSYMIPYWPPYEDPTRDFPPERITDFVKRSLGPNPPPFEIIDVSRWRMDCEVARDYDVDCRLFFVGDAAHRFPPTGGLGLNTGIADAHNLVWKLARVMKGDCKNEKALLKTYSTERRPVAELNGYVSYDNYRRMFQLFEKFGIYPSLAPIISRVFMLPWFIPRRWRIKTLDFFRSRVLAQLAFWKIKGKRDQFQEYVDLEASHFSSFGLDLGYVYGGPAISPHASDPPPNRYLPGLGLKAKQMPSWTLYYIPRLQAGGRLPHKSLENQISTHVFVDYTCSGFVVFLAAAKSGVVHPWEGVVEKVGSRLGVKLVKVFPTSPKDQGNWPVRDLDGCLLVRPDGHVAWFQEGGHGVVESEFQAAVERASGLF